MREIHYLRYASLTVRSFVTSQPECNLSPQCVTTVHPEPKFRSYHKVIMVTTGRAHCHATKKIENRSTKVIKNSKINIILTQYNSRFARKKHKQLKKSMENFCINVLGLFLNVKLQFLQRQPAPETAPSMSTPSFLPHRSQPSHNMLQFNSNPTTVVSPAQSSVTNLSSTTAPAVNTPVSSNPQSAIFTISLLQCCPPLVRSCFGCFQTLKPAGTIAAPPYDLVLISRMPRTFNSRYTGEIMTREGNVYFHLNANCIRQKQPYYVYDPRTTVISPYITNHLRAKHYQMLQSFIQSF